MTNAARVGTVPQAVEAEESLLGALMLSRGAIEAALDGVELGDFYTPKHATIYAAIMAIAYRGGAVDPVTVADELRRMGALDEVGGPKEVQRIQMRTPASANAVFYAEAVAVAAALRRALAVSSDLRDLAMAADLDGVERLIQGAAERLSSPLALVEPGTDLMAVLEHDPPPTEWLIPNCLGRRERVIITGEEGRGKSVLLRQLGIQVACGVHPWDITAMDRVRVLHVDMENSPDQSAREYAWIANDGARRKYEAGWLAVKYRPQGLDLTRRGDVRWLEALLNHHRPDLLIIGPLYKMMRGTDRRSIHSEEAAAEVAFALDLLRVRYDVALLIEGHSPHIAQGAKKRDLRPIGASLWLRWPEYGIGLSVSSDSVGTLTRWRLDRVKGRRWPEKLVQDGASWPWTVPEAF